DSSWFDAALTSYTWHTSWPSEPIPKPPPDRQAVPVATRVEPAARPAWDDTGNTSHPNSIRALTVPLTTPRGARCPVPHPARRPRPGARRPHQSVDRSTIAQGSLGIAGRRRSLESHPPDRVLAQLPPRHGS